VEEHWPGSDKCEKCLHGVAKWPPLSLNIGLRDAG
jgi:hypothetical protein